MWVLLFALAQDPGSGYDRWYEVLMGDDRVGSMHAVSASSPDGTRRVESSTVMDILRAGTLIHWSMVVESVEGPDGAPLSVRVEQAQGGQATTSVLRFADGEALLSVSAGGRELPEARAAYEAGCSGPAAAERAIAAALAAGASRGDSCVYDGVNGLAPARSSWTLVERVDGDDPRWHLRIAVPAMPGADMDVWVDAAGVARTTIQPAGGFVLTIRETAGPPDADVQPPELFLSTLITPSRTIATPRAARRGTFVLATRSGGPVDLPSLGSQEVRRLDDGRVTVTVDLADHEAAAASDLFLGRSALIDPEDPATRALAADAVAGVDGDAARAEAMRRAVYRHIQRKDLGTGLGSSAEAVASASGDCTEHAVLLAAMLRSQGIPARVVSGVVYLGGVFGYHMWTEAILPEGGERVWVDLDATLSERDAFDATHIALGATALDDRSGQRDLMRITPMIGNLEIEVRKVR